MKYNPKSEFDCKKAQLYLDKLILGTTPFEVKSLKQRSKSQNAKLHVFLAYLALEIGYCPKHVKLNIWKMKWCRGIFYIEEVNRKTGEIYKIIRSSADLNDEEMAMAIKILIEKSFSECGVLFPDKNSTTLDDDLILMSKEVWANQQYL